MRMSLKGTKEFLTSLQWLKPYLQILSAQQFSQLLKLALSALHRFLLCKGGSVSEIFTERVLNELILVLINCKFEEIDLHDTYNTSIMILRVLEAIFLHKAALKLRQDTILALLDYLEDESQLEGLKELSKVGISQVVQKLFSASEMYQTEVQSKVLAEVFKHVCHTIEHLCMSREALKSSSDYKLKLFSVDSLNYNLSLMFRILKLAGPFLNSEHGLVSCICGKLCPVLHQVCTFFKFL